MAKPTLLKLALVVVLTMAASSSAYATSVSQVGTSVGGSSFAPSNKVKCYYVSDATASNSFDGSNYGIACGHDQGDKVIAARNGDAKLYFKTMTANNATSGAATIGLDSVTATATWTSM